MQKIQKFEEAMELYSQGESCKSIARKVGLSECFITKLAKRTGVKRPEGYKPDRRGHRPIVHQERNLTPLTIKESFYEDCKRIMQGHLGESVFNR